MNLFTRLLKQFPVFLLILLYACQSYPKKVQTTIKKSGNNHTELESAIEHYKTLGDSLKIEALYYIQGQMQYYGTLHYQFVNLRGEEISIEHWDYKNIPEATADLNKKGLRFTRNTITEDVKTITKDYLISNIDLAFEVWRSYPWCEDLSFQQFCQQILPYKINGDRLDAWRSYYYYKYKKQLDSLKAENANREQVCYWLNSHNEMKWIKSMALIPSSYITFVEIEKMGGGSCDHLAKNAVNLMRACGIPLNLDIIPFHGKINGGHAYNSLYTSNNDFIYFSPYERDPERSKWRAPRVFRQVFEIQPLLITNYIKTENLPPGVLGNPFLIDVTNEYFPTIDVLVEVSEKKGIVFLCTYNKREFKAINWGLAKSGQVLFENTTKELLYFPMYYEKPRFIPAADPFIIRDNGKIFEVNEKKDTLVNLMNVKLLAVNTNITHPNTTYSLYHWNGRWEYINDEIASNEKIIDFTDVKVNGLFLVRGPERLEQLQRPFTCIDSKIEYW